MNTNIVSVVSVLLIYLFMIIERNTLIFYTNCVYLRNATQLPVSIST